MEAARVLKLRGHKPVIYEKSDIDAITVATKSSNGVKEAIKDALK